MNGGYDDGYRECPCFWGTEPGTFVQLLQQHLSAFSGLRILDAGCGEGKNAAFLARQGAFVDAVDLSDIAISNGRRHWQELSGLSWQIRDIRRVELPREHYDVVVAYGLLHCMPSIPELMDVLARLQNATRVSGHFVLCAFNSRRQELDAHPGFAPTLLSHADYLAAFSGWQIVAASDTDITERHPHNNIEHTHALTRLLARKEPQ
ncbi:MAG TPA: class I SAM-dependent methyltransferase [Bryobacteraceae bacterium]|nr:class I SAM-dependent methyltransferase [Bryobacteraceae bacterium]